MQTIKTNAAINILEYILIMPRGSLKKTLKAYIAAIPASKLSGPFSTKIATIYTDDDFRLDMQSVCAFPLMIIYD